MTRKSDIQAAVEELSEEDDLPPLSAVLRGEAEIPPVEEDEG